MTACTKFESLPVLFAGLEASEFDNFAVAKVLALSSTQSENNKTPRALGHGWR